MSKKSDERIHWKERECGMMIVAIGSRRNGVMLFNRESGVDG